MMCCRAALTISTAHLFRTNKAVNFLRSQEVRIDRPAFGAPVAQPKVPNGSECKYKARAPYINFGAIDELKIVPGKTVDPIQKSANERDNDDRKGTPI